MFMAIKFASDFLTFVQGLSYGPSKSIRGGNIIAELWKIATKFWGSFVDPLFFFCAAKAFSENLCLYTFHTPVGMWNLPNHFPWRSFMKFVDRSHVTSLNQRFFKCKILKTWHENVHVRLENDWSDSFVLLYGWNNEDVRWGFSLFKSIGKLWAI